MLRSHAMLICFLISSCAVSAEESASFQNKPEHPELEGAEAAEPVAAEALTALEEAERCVQKGQIEEAVRRFQDFGKKWPVHPRAPYVAARMAELQAQLAFREREAEFLEKIREYGSTGVWEGGRVGVWEDGRVGVKEDGKEEGKSERPGNLSRLAHIRAELAQFYLAHHKIAEARRVYEAILAESPDTFEGFQAPSVLGGLLERQGELDKALEGYRKALEGFDERLKAYLKRTAAEDAGLPNAGYPAIRRVAELIGGRVVTMDRGRNIGGGFGALGIGVPGRVRSLDSVIRLVEAALR